MNLSKANGPEDVKLEKKLTPLSFANKWLDREPADDLDHILQQCLLQVKKTAGMVFTMKWRTCPQRCQLYAKYKRFARVSISDDTGKKYKNAGDNIKCFGCQSKINFGIGYFRCRNRECDYDVCNRCALCSGVDDASEGEGDDSDFEFEEEDKELPPYTFASVNEDGLIEPTIPKQRIADIPLKIAVDWVDLKPSNPFEETI